jgi:hypothetical protein
MDAKERAERIRTEKGKALVRQLHLSELQAAGAARDLALHAAEEQLNRIAKLLPDALEGGLTLAEISRITNVSRPTLYELRARYGGTAGDLRLAVLQLLARQGPMWQQEVIDAIGGRDEAGGMLVELFQQDLVDVEPGIEDPDRNTGPAFELTGKGFETLENWTFALDEESREKE